VPASTIGAIQILDDHALVDVSAAQANDIVRALTSSTATIKGRKVPVRLDR
jgi:hypothetical protein